MQHTTAFPLSTLFALSLLFTTSSAACGQQSAPISTSAESAAAPQKDITPADLPDAPDADFLASSSSPQSTSPPLPPQPGQPSKSIKSPETERRWYRLGYDDPERAAHEASPTEKYILPGQLAPKLTTGNKVEFGFIHGVSAYGVLGWFVTAGYSHVINTTPNYGTDRGAFGERLGASALRGYTTEVLKDSLTANLFHQDPRYYKMGPRRNPAVRTVYAVTRVLVTRGDDGRLAPNYSLVSGHLLGAALTNAYYPDIDRGFGQTAKTFGSSMYGAAFSFFAAEFLNGALEAIHLKPARN